jgi:Trk K+ transport system NAD-binding subunit
MFASLQSRLGYTARVYKKLALPKNSKKDARKIFLVLRVLMQEFKAFLITLVLAFSLSVWLFYTFYPRDLLPSGHEMTIAQAAYYTLLLIFFESPLQYVEDWRLAPLFFLLPLIGLLIIAEGVVHLGNLLFQHKRYSKEWQRMIAETMENHIVVCGLGNVGVRVVQHLRRFNEDVVVIEKNPESRFVSEVAGYSVPVLYGDVRDYNMLEQARVGKARALIAVTDDDLANLEAALTARELKADIRVVIRMFDQKLAKKVEKSLGIQGAYSSSARSARVFAQAAINGNILDSFEFGGTVINAIQIVVADGSKLAGETVDHLRKQYDVTVLCQEKNDGSMDWNPEPTSVLAVGDKLLVMTDSEGYHRIEQATMYV